MFRLCGSLRVALRETQRLVRAVSTQDCDTLQEQMGTILATEGAVAVFVGRTSQQHASDARSAGQDPKRTQSVRNGLAAFRNALIAERQRLLRQELDRFNAT
jgi:hypothetical protein